MEATPALRISKSFAGVSTGQRRGPQRAVWRELLQADVARLGIREFTYARIASNGRLQFSWIP